MAEWLWLANRHSPTIRNPFAAIIAPRQEAITACVRCRTNEVPCGRCPIGLFEWFRINAQ